MTHSRVDRTFGLLLDHRSHTRPRQDRTFYLLPWPPRRRGTTRVRSAITAAQHSEPPVLLGGPPLGGRRPDHLRGVRDARDLLPPLPRQGRPARRLPGLRRPGDPHPGG